MIRMMTSRRMRWSGHLACMGRRIIHIEFCWGKPEGKRPLGRPRHTWEDNCKMDLREIRWGGMDWIDITQDSGQWKAHMNMVMNLWVP
jgi:hypothetical protein